MNDSPRSWGIRLQRASSRWPAIPRGAAIVVLLWAALVITFDRVNAAHGGGGTVCMFKNVTGLPCPTCGGTRSARAVSRGEFRAAFIQNPAIFVAEIAVVVWLVLRIGFGRGVVLEASARARRAIAAVVVVLCLLNWAYVIAIDGPWAHDHADEQSQAVAAAHAR